MDQDENAQPTPENMARELLALMPSSHAKRTVESMRDHMWRGMVPCHFGEDDLSVSQRLIKVAAADAWLQRVGDLVDQG